MTGKTEKNKTKLQ